jgi:carboxymethylenebutenolidase
MTGRVEHIEGGRGLIPVYVCRPEGDGPFPGVVVIHDALGMSSDLRNQAEWLARDSFLAVAPDLYHWGRRLRCVLSVMRDAARGSGGAFDDLDAVRRWVADDPGCTGQTGVIGFCMGGGFAVLLAPTGHYQAASVNYGGLPKDPAGFLRGACPVVGSYGARDRTLRNTGSRLAEALAANEVVHDVKTYPDAGHGFLNDHSDDDVPWPIEMLAWVSSTDYHEPSASDARRRIVDFFRTHLGGREPTDRGDDRPDRPSDGA